MLKLEQTNHEYYCECWENNRHQEFQSWKEFKAELPYDKDYNLLFRFDFKEVDPELKKNYFDESRRIDEYRDNMKTEAFNLINKYFWHLWD